METTETKQTEKENAHFIDKVVKAFRRAADELEEFQVQAALGKAKATDKYEEVKDKFNSFVVDSKDRINKGKEKYQDLQAKLDELKVQLALGKANTLAAFREQKKKILRTIHDIEVKIKHNETLNRLYAVLLVELEKFKVQLEWMEQKFKDGRVNAQESFVKSKAEFFSFIEGLKERFSKKKETRWEQFQGEMSEAFTHFRKAFVKS